MGKVPKSSAASEVVMFPHQPALQLIYDTAPIGLACLSPDCRYLQINQRLTEICGISVEDHLGRFVRDCVPGLADAVEEIVRSIMATGEPVIGIEVAGQRADQIEERSWITYWHPLRASSGEIVAVNVAAEEITERKRAEQRVRNARDAAETALRHLRETQESLIEAEKLAALGRLVAGVAHEVNSPVGSGLTVASTLQHKVEQFAQEVARGGLRRSRLNEFLDLVRDASSQLVSNLDRAAERVQSFKQLALDQGQSRRRSFDAGELTKEVLSHLARESGERGIALNFTCEGDLAMDSYPGPFGQALTNLVLNAMIHAYPEGRSGSIDIEVRPADRNHIEVVIADDGCGMAPEVKRQAFDPFFTTRRHEGATGLGLHTVHSILVDRLGGRIRLDSEPDVGTVVRLVMPRSAVTGD
ncbi:ATP-binding protein [Bradyrhizobium sp. Tv2a-2]|uniref:ATP-binding protein n=1 Tax=Bradyrhizobium sp. Tv2a-2 TaxID=113395 RepID=UPI000464C1A1|nr:ATP-binding protein [Bradyrhizobium sp. Tv2a-2]